VVRTEKLQFILMYAGFALILYFAVAKFGGFAFLKQNLPATHLVWHGGNSPLFIFVWYFIAMSTLIDPTFYQRCFAAKDERTARNGILISVLCWALFDFMTTATGLYARAILPELSNAVESYPRLALEVLPRGARGIFYVALFAIIMSTVDGFAFTSAVTLGKDILVKLSFTRGAFFLLRKKQSANYQVRALAPNDSPLEGGQGGVAQDRKEMKSSSEGDAGSDDEFKMINALKNTPLTPLKGGIARANSLSIEADQEQRQKWESAVTRLTQLGLVLTFIFAIAIALWARSVVAIWYQLGTIVTPALLFPLASSFSEKWRMRSRMALASMLVSASITGVWLWNQSGGKYWWGIEPIFPGLMCAAIFFVLGIKKSHG